MKTVLFWGRMLALVAILFALPMQTLASGCRFAYQSYSTYRAPTYYAPAKVVVEKNYVVAPVPVVASYLPLYSALYVPPAAPIQAVPKSDPALVELLKQFGGRLESLERSLAPRQQQPQQQPPVMPPAENGRTEPQQPPPQQSRVPTPDEVRKAVQTFVEGRCAKCHSDSRAERDLSLLRGGKLIDPSELTPEQRLHIIERLDTTDPKEVMPPPSAKLPATQPDEYYTVRLWLRTKK